MEALPDAAFSRRPISLLRHWHFILCKNLVRQFWKSCMHACMDARVFDQFEEILQVAQTNSQLLSQ